MIEQQFDAYNNPVFVSYPSISSGESDGTVYEYDGLQRLKAQYSNVSFSGETREYLSGNRVRSTNGRHYSTTTTFRALGAPSYEQVEHIEQPEGVTTTITYNLFGNPTQITQGGETEVRRYNAQQNLCRVVRNDVGHTVYDYNALGEVTWEAKGASGSGTDCDLASVTAAEKSHITYDNVGSVRTISYPDASGTITHTYDAQGNLLTLASGNSTWAYTYNTLGHVMSEALSVDGQQFNFASHYNTLGHLTTHVYPSGRVVNYAPNGYGEATQSGGYANNVSYAPSGQVESFDYDVLGNITQKTLGNDTLTYHYTNNRLKSVSGTLNRLFTYDTRGNVESNGVRSFTFNRAGRLASSGSISYLYDGHGRRIMKNNSGSKTYSLYSQQGRLISTIHNGAVTDYIYLGGQLVARHSNNQPNNNQPGYTGHLEDDDLQLTYMQQRYYDPVIGRFYSNDPVGFSASNPMMFNRYAYANNNPYKYVDPDGREVKLQWHEVFTSGKNHTLLTIRPDNPSHFNNVNRISSIGRLTNSNGERYGTMGAGPNWNFRRLVSDYNREYDALERPGGIVIQLPKGMTENQFVDRLIELDANYQDNLRYSLSPDGIDTFNSNSYVSGLLEAAGVDISGLDVPDAPGFDKPIPAEHFERKE